MGGRECSWREDNRFLADGHEGGVVDHICFVIPGPAAGRNPESRQRRGRAETAEEAPRHPCTLARTRCPERAGGIPVFPKTTPCKVESAPMGGALPHPVTVGMGPASRGAAAWRNRSLIADDTLARALIGKRHVYLDLDRRRRGGAGSGRMAAPAFSPWGLRSPPANFSQKTYP